MTAAAPALPWLPAGSCLPPAEMAWGPDTDAPGLLCAGADLSVATLTDAYCHGIFPWFSAGQPLLWWSPDPRMVLAVDEFRLHPSMKKSLKQFIRNPQSEIRVDAQFEEVMRACARTPRAGQSGTWIVPDMVQAYTALHRAGLAHSVEVWMDGQRVAGLYVVAIGNAVFGESMYHRVTDGSKLALCALVALCRQLGVSHIDCQQNTRHLTSLGARERPRHWFVQHVEKACQAPTAPWDFSPLYWNHLLSFTVRTP